MYDQRIILPPRTTSFRAVCEACQAEQLPSRGYVGATHLKIIAQSWHDARNMTPLFPVIRVLGRISIEVLEVQGG